MKRTIHMPTAGTHSDGTGLYGLPESALQFETRIAEINRLELQLKLHALDADERDRLQRQIDRLKGVNDNAHTDAAHDPDND